jgi:hypothetical protein
MAVILRKVKVKVHPCTGRTAHRGSRGIALPYHDHDTRRGWGVSVTPRPLFTSRKGPVPIVEEAGWAPGLVWSGVENLAPTRIRSPDRPACSHLLYRLRYPIHCNFMCGYINGSSISFLLPYHLNLTTWLWWQRFWRNLAQDIFFTTSFNLYIQLCNVIE